ncbi:MAG: hypothetical protein IJ612_07450 [Prevotella sp.]|nr:hypothetical protein [Prevotella sp.]
MANKRSLKRAINAISEELFAECVAASLYGAEAHKDNANALLHCIVKTQRHYISRVSHPEPGLPAKKYYADLRERYAAQVGEIIDQINAL